MGQTEKLFSSAAWLTGAFAVSGVFRLIAMGWVGQTLQPENFGRYQYLSGLYLYFYALSEFGLATLGARQIAQNLQAPAAALSGVLQARLLMTGLAFASLLLFSGSLAGKDSFFLILLGLQLWLQAMTMDWVLRGLGSVPWVAVGETLRSGAFLVGVAFWVRSPEHMDRVLVLQLACGLLLAIGYAIPILKKFGGVQDFLHSSGIGMTLSMALPIASGEMVASYFGQCDLILLHWLSDSTTVGLYAPGLRFIAPIILLISTMLQAWLPLLSTAFQESLASFEQMLRRILIGMAGLSLLGAVFTWLLAPWILEIFFGSAFAGGSRSFQILLLSCAVLACRAPLSMALIVCHQEWLYFALILAASVVKTVACILLIPGLDLEGAAMASLIAELFFAACAWMALQAALTSRKKT